MQEKPGMFSRARKVFGASSSESVTNQQDSIESAKEYSPERAIELVADNPAVHEAVADYMTLREFVQSERAGGDASALENRIKKIKEVLAESGIILEFVPSKFNKETDDSIVHFAGLYKETYGLKQSNVNPSEEESEDFKQAA